MNDSLGAIVVRVRSGSENIATATGQIAAGNIDLSARTEEQASALEQNQRLHPRAGLDDSAKLRLRQKRQPNRRIGS